MKGHYDWFGAMLQAIGRQAGSALVLPAGESRVCNVFQCVMQLTPASQRRPFVTNPSFE
jgi:hypothetical protein